MPEGSTIVEPDKPSSSRQPSQSRGTVRQPFSSETIPERPVIAESDRSSSSFSPQPSQSRGTVRHMPEGSAIVEPVRPSFSPQPSQSRGTVRQPFSSAPVGEKSQNSRFPSAEAALGDPLPSLWDAAEQERKARQESSAAVDKVAAPPPNRSTAVSQPNPPPARARPSQLRKGGANSTSSKTDMTNASKDSAVDDPKRAQVLALTADIDKHEEELKLAKKSVAKFIEQFNGKFGRRPSKVERKQYARDTFKAYHQACLASSFHMQLPLIRSFIVVMFSQTLKDKKTAEDKLRKLTRGSGAPNDEDDEDEDEEEEEDDEEEEEEE